jgi:hypothetical protein
LAAPLIETTGRSISPPVIFDRTCPSNPGMILEPE